MDSLYQHKLISGADNGPYVVSLARDKVSFDPPDSQDNEEECPS